MCIYLLLDIFAFILVILGFNKNTDIKDKYLLLVCMAWAFITGFRAYTVGNDTLAYADFFSGRPGFFGTIDYPREDMEIGFVYLAKMLTTISINPTFSFTVISFLFFLTINYLYRHVNRDNALWSFAFFITFNYGFYSTIQSAVRQTASISMFLLGVYLLQIVKKRETTIKWYKNRGYIKPILLLFISACIHKTSLFLFPLILLCFFVKINKKIAYLLICLSLVISIAFSNYIGLFFDFSMSLISDSSNEMISHLDNYSESLSDQSMNIFGCALRTFVYLIIVYYTDKEKTDDIYFNNLILSIVMFNLFFTSFQFQRIALVFTILAGAVYIPQAVMVKRKARIIFGGLSLLYLYRAFISYSTWVESGGDSSLPYLFIWD